jgi:hypothetical protein
MSIEGIAIGQQVGELVADAAVDVHATVVEEGIRIRQKRASESVGMAEERGVFHAAEAGIRGVSTQNQVNSGVQVFAHDPLVLIGVIFTAVGLIHPFAPHIGEGLIDGTGEAEIDEPRRELRDAVGQLVGNDVVHAEAVPKSISVISPLPSSVLPGLRLQPSTRCKRAH